MSISVQNGTSIVRTPSGIATHCGAFSSSDIDLDVTRNSPASAPELALAWIQNLLTTAGITAPTATQEIYANMAQRWWSWLYYWRMSRLSENCPDTCKDPEKYEETKLWAQQECCAALTALGLRDDTICFSAEQQTRTKLDSSLSTF